jgi:hypothetical protein
MSYGGHSFRAGTTGIAAPVVAHLNLSILDNAGWRVYHGFEDLPQRTQRTQRRAPGLNQVERPINPGRRRRDRRHCVDVAPSEELVTSRPIGTCRVRNVPEQHSGDECDSHIPLPGTPREARLWLVPPSTKEAAARPKSVVAAPSINHSSDHAVRATLGRQGRTRRPVIKNGTLSWRPASRRPSMLATSTEEMSASRVTSSHLVPM